MKLITLSQLSLLVLVLISFALSGLQPFIFLLQFSFGPPNMDNLKRVAREGNVSDLYALIREDGNVLKHFDEVEFIDTPLHIAADAGCNKFAMEIMGLKPSFARKLNPQGLTPLHLAIEKEHRELVLLLLKKDKDLVRVKGKNGETPLHYLITRFPYAQEKLLRKFLKNCSESIQDMTTENQTALHIAAANKKEDDLRILCKTLWKTNYCQDVVNRKDENGNTALHIAARSNQHQMIKLLLKCKANKHATNLDGLTALGVAERLDNRESISILRDFYIPEVPPFINKLQKQSVKYVKKASLLIFHDMDNIPIEYRNALLVILGLLLTATYQASLSPPRGVLQGDNDKELVVVKPVMYQEWLLTKYQIRFLSFYIPVSSVFMVTFFLTLGLLKPFPRGFRTALQVLLSFLAISFYQSISFLAPTDLATTVINLFSVLLFVLMMFMCFAYRVSKVGVLILGCWLIPTVFDLHFLDIPLRDIVNLFMGNSIVACLLFLFLYDEFLKGTILVIGYALLIGLGYMVSSYSYEVIIYPIIVVLGWWLFLSLCRFFIKRFFIKQCGFSR